MELSSREYKRAIVLRVVGRVDANSAKHFEEEIQRHVTTGPSNLILELDSADYLSSAGVRVLITAQKTLKQRGGAVMLASPSERVREVMQMAGLDPLFPVYSDTETALGSI